MHLGTALLYLLRAVFLGRQHLALENIALRQQLTVLKRKNPRPRIKDRDRRFWLIMRAVHKGWRDCLHLVQPDTVIRWHQKTWRFYWWRKSKHRRPGRPAIGRDVMHLIWRMQRENATWGAPRITSELLLLGHDIGESTVSRYMKQTRDPAKGQQWRTFLKNHAKGIAACDCFVVPTIFFRRLFVLVVLSHDRRVIRHIAVTSRPTAAWSAQQIREAFPDEKPTHLIHDNDGVFRKQFREHIEAMGITDVPITPSRWLQNVHCERVIGTLRRECTDRIVTLNEQHLQSALREYVSRYYNTVRPHLRLERNAPIPRQREAAPVSRVSATPILGGLHHQYERAA